MSDQPRRRTKWGKARLGDLITLEYGAALSERARRPGAYPVFGSNGIVGTHDRPLVRGPGIVVGRKGSVGKLAWSDTDFWPIDTAYYIASTKPLDWRWLYWALQQLDLPALNAATGVPGLNRNDVYSRAIDEPPTTEQPLLAEILDGLSAAIRENEAVVAKLRQVKAGLLHDLLTRGLDEQGRLRDPTRSPEQFQDSPLGQVPLSWTIQPIGDYITSSAFGPRFAGELYDKQGNIATMRTTDMDDEGNLDLDAMPRARLRLADYEKHLLQENDVLVSRSGTCGITAVFNGFNRPVLPGAFLIRFRLSAGLLPEFLRTCLNWRPNRQRLLVRAEGGVQKNLRTESITGLRLPFPQPDEQQDILNILAGTAARLRAEEERLSKLQSLERGLAHDLLTGAVRINERL